ncbi:MAG: UbiA family prenyltransferase, partial [Bacteroidota bacterium]|nr:UbiA family prenyltransferase [Bacteroidota bacterium]MDX5431466.1 UbiA family prenyltransferase [Bacteroidota bacterium]MDX5470193.1 UbiA family prenyltransferase [Bacteroidota bacterium]
IALSMALSPIFALMIGLYILASRLYSNRRIRIKKYPVFGFIWVSFFQGAFVYWTVQTGISAEMVLPEFSSQPFAKLVSSLLLGAIYPLTQVYQHESDRKDGVQTLSMLLGYRGTFFFTAILFALANGFAYLHFSSMATVRSFMWMQLFFIPVTLYFLYWFYQVWKNEQAADFIHAMRMNLLASMCLNVYYLTLILSA